VRKWFGCASPTPKAVEAVLFGPQGVESTIGSGAIVVDPARSRRLPSVSAERLRGKRRRLRGCSRYGFEVAASGNLIFMVGGDEACSPDSIALQSMGKQVFRMGETSKGPGRQTRMNLPDPLIYEGFAEALNLARSWRDLETLLPYSGVMVKNPGLWNTRRPSS